MHCNAFDGPGREDLGGRLGVDNDVPLRDRRRVAEMVIGAAHDHQSAQQRRQRGFGAQGQRQIGQRAGRHPDQFAGKRVCRAHPGRRGIVVGEPAIGRRQLGIPHPPRAVHLRGGAHRAGQGFVGALGHRDVSGSAKLEQAEVVFADLLYRNVSTGRGDADYVGFGAGQQVNQGQRIVDAGVDVDENRGLHHGEDTGTGIRLSQCPKRPNHLRAT